jgi:hypothetical protein
MPSSFSWANCISGVFGRLTAPPIRTPQPSVAIMVGKGLPPRE